MVGMNKVKTKNKQTPNCFTNIATVGRVYNFSFLKIP